MGTAAHRGNTQSTPRRLAFSAHVNHPIDDRKRTTQRPWSPSKASLYDPKIVYGLIQFPFGGFHFPVSELITSRYDALDHDGEEGEGAGAQPADDLLYGKLV